MQTALDSPERVERLVLIGTASTANNEVVREPSRAIRDLKDPVPPAFVRDFQVSTSSPALPSEFIDTVVSESMKQPACVSRSALAGVMAKDHKSELHRLKVPVTIFWGDKENVFLRNEQDILTNGIPNSKLIVYPDAGHAPHWEQPDKFANDLNRLLVNG